MQGVIATVATTPLDTAAVQQQRAAMNSVFEQRNKILSASHNGQAPASTGAAQLNQQMLALQRSLPPAAFDFLPGGLPTKHSFTRVSPLKKTDSLPDISAVDQAKLKEWVVKDNSYEDLLTHSRQMTRKAMEQQAIACLREGDWIGNMPSSTAGTAWAHAPPGGAFNMRSTTERTRSMMAGKRKNRVHAVQQCKNLAAPVVASFTEDEEWLIPIRLEYEHDTHKIRDVFTWNMRDAHITPEIFVRMLVEDLMLPQQPFQRELVNQINLQIDDARRTTFRDNVFPHRTDDEIHEDEIHDDIDEAFWRKWRKRIEQEDGGAANDAELEAEDTQAMRHEELRIIIKLDITFGTWQLNDQIEWDVADPRNIPEHFAKSYAADLGLPGEFVTAIAHSIREQADVFAKSLGLIEHQPGNTVIHEELRFSFLPPLGDVLRTDATEVSRFTPYLQELSLEDLERQEKEREREFRRKKRQTRGRQVVTLPDREPLKTHRTFMPMPGAQPIKARMDDDHEHAIIPALPIAQPYPIIRRSANLPKPVPMLQDDDSEARMKQPRETSRRGRGRGRPPKYGTGDRAMPQTSLAGHTIATGASEWFIKAESPSAASPMDSETAAIDRKPKPKSANSARKRKRYGSPTPEELASQRDNYIDGMWHCANCGGPENIVPGRRLGPKGKDTLCGECGAQLSHSNCAPRVNSGTGKFYHRNRKSRPCEYNTSPAHHIALRQAAAASKQAPTVAVMSRESSFMARHTGSSESEESEEEPIRRARRPPQRDTDYVDVDMHNISASHRTSDPFSHSAATIATPVRALTVGQPMAVSSASNPQLTAARQSPPIWMLQSIAELRASKPDDRFEIMARPKPANDPSTFTEWRIRCSDCPGKLYTPGPGETLDNFTVHLKNRAHRANVDRRLGRSTPESH